MSFVFAFLLIVVWNFTSIGGTEVDLTVVVLSQPNSYHENKAHLLRQDLYDQAALLNISSPGVYLTHEQWPDVTGAWTVFPIIPLLVGFLNESDSFVLFCRDDLSIDLSLLKRKLEAFQLSEELFLGRALRDQEATIIHHFAFFENPTSFLYPDFAAGFIISAPLMRRLAEKLTVNSLPVDFTIDFQHELALFIWDKGAGVSLTDVEFLCGYTSETSECATRLQRRSPECGLSVSDSNIFFAVKTCQKFHNDRIPFLKATWGKDARNIGYFSDTEDSSIPTITLGIQNTERGHCAKFMAILNYVYRQLNTIDYKWIIIADDDTLLSVARLTRLLSCYDPSSTVVLGERYGYGVAKGYGYDYITLGGGMALSQVALRELIESDSCHCASPDSPDDMTFGLCLKHLEIPVTHSPLFHQARPVDYAVGYLSDQESISFHRHWMIDPIEVYKKWLVNDHANEVHDHKTDRSINDRSMDDHRYHKEL